jgi:hypothetical protein
MDEIKREIWLSAVGTMIVELPAAIAAFIILAR